MSTERRKSPREEKDVRVSVVLGQAEIPANLANISKTGALVRIESANGDVSEADFGRHAVLLMEAGASQVRYRGTVCRYFEEGQTRYLAVDFGHHLFA